jgi:hypothetical protein
MSPAAFLSHGTGVRIPVPVPKNPKTEIPKLEVQTTASDNGRKRPRLAACFLRR